MLRNIALIAALLLAACSDHPSLPETMQSLNQRFVGHEADAFFADYGDPSGKTSTDGGTLYRWVWLEPYEASPQPAYSSYATPRGNFAVPQFGSGMAMETQYCQIEVEADQKDIIRKISFLSDTPGKWGNSLCAEIFSKPYWIRKE